MALAILNRDPQGPPLEGGFPRWRTCLREVAFSDVEGDALPAAGGRRMVEGEAYRMLLEILCGLQSPMLGETQVMGQFKAFLAELGRDHGWLNRLGQRLLTDAREIRTQHLQGLGSRSYGSAVRRYLSSCGQAVLVGTGKLAAEVLPFLNENGRTIDQWGRSGDAGAGGVTYRLLDAMDDFSGSSAPAAIIIAAPVPSDVVNRLAARYPHVTCVIDLRGEAVDPLSVPARVVTLQDLFTLMHESNRFAVTRVEAARADIVARSRRFEMRDELRPFGWDDLCA